jgi:hypothetical protein
VDYFLLLVLLVDDVLLQHAFLVTHLLLLSLAAQHLLLPQVLLPQFARLLLHEASVPLVDLHLLLEVLELLLPHSEVLLHLFVLDCH